MTVQLLLLVGTVVETLLVDDGVNGNCSFTSLPVTDDELALSTSDGHQTVDGLDSGLHGLLHRGTGDDARCLHSHTPPLAG